MSASGGGVISATLLSGVNVVPGASVEALGTNRRAVSDAQGKFTLTGLPYRPVTLVITSGTAVTTMAVLPAPPRSSRGRGILRISSGPEPVHTVRGRSDSSSTSSSSSSSTSSNGGSGEVGHVTVHGTVASIDTTADTFVVTLADGSTVNVATTTETRYEMQGVGEHASFANLAVNDVVEVEGTADSTGTVTAENVEIHLGGSQTGATEVSGVVQSVDTSTDSFTVQSGDPTTLTIDTTSSTVFKEGDKVVDFSALADGESVQVAGTTNSDGSITASEVMIEQPDSGETEVKGVVQTVDSSTNSFTIQTSDGTTLTIDTTSSTVFKQGDTAADFSAVVVGATAEVSGTTNSDGSITAAEVSIEQTEVEVSGTVQSIDTSTDSFTIQTSAGTVVIDTTSSTVYRQGDTTVDFSAITVGASVEVSGTANSDGSVTADKVSIEESSSDQVELKGTITAIDSGSSSFTISTEAGPFTIQTTSSTTFEMGGSAASFTDLAVNQMVGVQGTASSSDPSTITATSVWIQTGD